MDSRLHFNGSNGIAIGRFSDYGRICYQQDDLKMITAGDVKNGFNFGYTKMGLVRYDNNGELDLSFRTNGVVVRYPNNQDYFVSGIEHDAAGNLCPGIVSQKRELIVLNVGVSVPTADQMHCGFWCG